MNNVRTLLYCLEARGYGFEVYGLGESEADIQASTVDEAWPHITGQDEVIVYLWKDGHSEAQLNIIMEDGEPDCYDYGSCNKNIMDLLDSLTQGW